MLAGLGRLDDLLYRVERAMVAAMLAVMGAVVFLDVVHRVSTRAGSVLANPIFIGGTGAVVACLALRTRGSERWHWGGALVGFGVGAGQWAFVAALPNGLVWSQTLALALTLWMGIVGASLAAHDRRHLALDIGSKLWPSAWAHRVAAVGHLVTASFCVLLIFLGWRSVTSHHELWSSTDGAAGILTAIAIPKWIVFASVPYGMAILCFRFLLEAARTWTGQGPSEEGADEVLHQLGIEKKEDVAR